VAASDQQTPFLCAGTAVPPDIGYAQSMLLELRTLRRRVIQAWQERAVALTKEEQAELRDEIRETCSLLTDLTRSS
jgi:hypothetical protein